MTKRDQELMIAELLKLADRIAAEPAIAEQKAREDAARGATAHPGLAHLYGDRSSAFEVGWLGGAMEHFARDLRSIVAAYAPRPVKRRRAKGVAAVGILIALLAGAGCVSDDAMPESEKLPTCAEIGAPDTLLCTSNYVCTWEGMECCAVPESGFTRAIDERCVTGGD